MYLLDTSALRALPGKILRNDTFFTPPYCVWELLTHLDGKDFAQRKGQLMKARFTHILNDPRAAIETPLLPHDTRLQRRVSDEELIRLALAALNDSDSLDRFYRSMIRDSNGEFHQVSGCVARTQEALAEAEREYMRDFQQIVSALRSGDVKLNSDMEQHGAILSLLNGDVIKLQRRGATDHDLRDKLLNSNYMYWSYVVHRALAHFRSGKTKLESNDYEDGQICRHLALDTSYCLVTADKGLKDALDKSIALVNRLDETKLRTEVRVMDVGLLHKRS
jgi:hypothetical protein